MNPLIILVGQSGTGKSTVAKLLGEKYGLKEIKTYTTRPKRGDVDNSHVFVTRDEFKALRRAMVAVTIFDGYHYGTTEEQYTSSDLVVWDVGGIRYHNTHYSDTRPCFTIYLTATEETRRKRMLARGDSPEAVERRILHDQSAFAGFSDEADCMLNTGCFNAAQIADIIVALYQKRQWV